MGEHMLEKVIQIYHSYNLKKRVKSELKLMKKHELKDKNLYLQHPFTIVDLRENLNHSYTSFDFTSNSFELRHRTSKERALSIMNTQYIFGRDGNSAAHFEHVKGSDNSASENGVNMYFIWNGPQSSVGTNHKYIADHLFHVSVHDISPVEATGHGYWESRIYPKTRKGLSLVGLTTNESPDNLMLFKEPINISIINFKERETAG